MKAEFPGQTGFSTANIRYAKRWYEFYNQRDMICQQFGDEILQQAVEEIQMPVEFGLVPWGQHIDIFTRSKSVAEALFYIEETIKNHWSRPELSAEIDAGLSIETPGSIETSNKLNPAEDIAPPRDFSL